MNKTDGNNLIKTNYKVAEQINCGNHINTNITLEQKKTINTSKLEGNLNYITTTKTTK